MGLAEVNAEIWERYLAPLLAPRDLLALAVAHRSFGEGALSEDIVWRACLRASFHVGDSEEPRPRQAESEEGRRKWTYRAMSTVIAGGARGEPCRQLATHAVEVSSQDRSGERKEHVLYESVCATCVENDRSACRCAPAHGNARVPCYWSSSRSNDENSSEWMTLRLRTNMAIISSLRITSYAAWWQREWASPPLASDPVYAPKGVWLEFLTLGEAEWEDAQRGQRRLCVSAAPCVTDVCAVGHQERCLDWRLARPELVVGGQVRVHFRGKQQVVPKLGGLYTCISYVGVRGWDIDDVDLGEVGHLPVLTPSQPPGWFFMLMSDGSEYSESEEDEQEDES